MPVHSPVAVLTGAGGGIGRATAASLARERFRVVLVGRTRTSLDATARLESSISRDAIVHVVTADQSRESDCRRIVEDTMKQFGRIDVLINNAAICPVAPLADTSIELTRQALETNFIGPVMLIQAALPVFARQGSGRIINVSSMAAVDPFPGLAVYAASKCALDSITRSIANECAGQGSGGGVEAYSIAPGAVETAMLRSVVTTEQLPQNRVLDPAAVAEVIVACALGKRRTEAGKVILLPSP
jgi:NAD(P)-dependent dehydrogenase (short-subunit alcohol dehydrogenase family)